MIRNLSIIELSLAKLRQKHNEDNVTKNSIKNYIFATVIISVTNKISNETKLKNHQYLY